MTVCSSPWTGLPDRLRRYSLRVALLASVVLPLVAALGIGGWLALRALERSIEERLQEDVELVARAIRLPISQAVATGSEIRLSRALESASRINRVYGVHVYDRRGRRVASMGSRQPARERPELAELATRGSRTGEYERVAGRRVYSYFVPLVDTGGRSRGLLQVTRRRSDFERYIRRARGQALGFLGLAAVLMVGLVLVGHRRAVGSHLERLGGSMARVGSGDREHRAALDGPVEIAALSERFNRMLDNLEATERELSDRREAQRSLERRLRHAEKLAAIGRLAAGVAHELGTPLSVVDGKAQRLLRGSTTGRVEAELEKIRAQVRRMESIVRQLLDFGGAHPLDRRRVAADRVAGAAADAVRSRAEGSGTQLEVVGPEPAAVILMDPARLERALINLLQNALDAAAARVRVGWFGDGEEAGFTVDDDGPGVKVEAAAEIFEPFFTTKPVGQGTGLGLAVVHGVVEEHGGRVEHGGSPLGGARFRIVLPTAGRSGGREGATDAG